MLDQHLMESQIPANEPRQVDWVLGACMLVNAEAVASVGALDQRYFLYFEDVDWCVRMWLGGWQVICLPDIKVLHIHHRSSAKHQWRFTKVKRFHLMSALRFYAKYPDIACSSLPKALPSTRPPQRVSEPILK
jgi:GT2 family glycosyltransferase